MPLTITLHLLAAIVWVGGMFFAYMVLRPQAASQFQPSDRLPLWDGCFERFFPWVWLAVVLLPATGYWMIFAVFGGMARAGLHIHIMNGLGLLMIGLYVWVFFGPYRSLKRAVAVQDWPRGGQMLNRIRQIVGTNLLLGLVTTAVAAGGRYL